MNKNGIEYIMICEIYIDGACQNAYVGNGSNNGGWCAIIKYGDKKRIIFGCDTNTTNNRMEIMPLCNCLPEILTRGITDIKIITDSMYVIYGLKGMKKWLRKKKEWPNQDLWRPLFKIIQQYNPTISCQWVKGHAGHPENEECNKIAEEQSKKVNIIGYKA